MSCNDSDDISLSLSSESGIAQEMDYSSWTRRQPSGQRTGVFDLYRCLGYDLPNASLPEQIIFNSQSTKDQPNTLAEYMCSVQQGIDYCEISDPLQIEKLFPSPSNRAWKEQLRRIVIFSVKPTDGNDKSVAMLIMGLNTRRPFDAEYRVFVELIQRHMMTGIAGVLLFTEEIRRAQALASLNRRKNTELKNLLAARTQELRKSEATFTRMAEVCPAGLFDAVGGKITFVNDAWYTLSGHPRELSVDSWADTVHSEDRAKAISTWNEAMKGNLVSAEIRFGQHWAMIVAKGSFDEQGVVNVNGYITDISGRKKYEELLQTRIHEAAELKRQQENCKVNSYIA